LRSFKSYLNHGAIGCDESLNMTESSLVNNICPNRLFHVQGKTEACAHWFSATLCSLCFRAIFECMTKKQCSHCLSGVRPETVERVRPPRPR
jgi:hypothetical protein